MRDRDKAPSPIAAAPTPNAPTDSSKSTRRRPIRYELPPPLPPDERRRLAAECVALRDDPDRVDEYRRSRETLVRSHLRLIASLSAGDDDLFQDGVAYACHAVDKWNPDRGANITTYIRIVVLSRLRGRRRRKLPIVDLDVDLITADQESAEETAIANEAAEHLADAMRRLTERQRQVLTLRFFESKTLSEASATLGITKQRVHQLEREALTALKKTMRANA